MKKWKPLEWAEESGQILKSVGPFLDRRARERQIYGYRKQYTSAADKPTRAQSMRARMAMGKVYFPRNASWAEALVDELLKFPNGRNDDQVDVLSLFGRMLDHLVSGQVPKAEKSLNDRIAEAAIEARRGDVIINKVIRQGRERRSRRKRI